GERLLGARRVRLTRAAFACMLRRLLRATRSGRCPRSVVRIVPGLVVIRSGALAAPADASVRVVALACVRALCCVGVRVVVASAFHGSHRAGALVHVTALGASSGTAGSFGERSRARIYIVAPPTVYAGAGVCIVRRAIGGPPIAWMGCDDGAERKAEREAYRGGVI